MSTSSIDSAFIPSLWGAFAAGEHSTVDDVVVFGGACAETCLQLWDSYALFSPSSIDVGLVNFDYPYILTLYNLNNLGLPWTYVHFLYILSQITSSFYTWSRPWTFESQKIPFCYWILPERKKNWPLFILNLVLIKETHNSLNFKLTEIKLRFFSIVD